MTGQSRLTLEAQADVADAYRWSEEQSLGLGLEYLRCVETALLAIQRAQGHSRPTTLLSQALTAILESAVAVRRTG